MGGLTSTGLPQSAHRWAQRTCQEQGLAVNITDPATVTRVAAVLRQVLDAPDRLESARVELAAVKRRSDHHVIENGGDNRPALMEVELGPLAT